MAYQAQKVCACTQSPQSMLVTHQAHVEVIVSHTTSIRNAQCAHQVYKGHTCTPSALSLCAHRVHKVGMHTRRTAMHYARAGLPTSNAQSGRVHTKSQCWARAHQAHDARRRIKRTTCSCISSASKVRAHEPSKVCAHIRHTECARRTSRAKEKRV